MLVAILILVGLIGSTILVILSATIHELKIEIYRQKRLIEHQTSMSEAWRNKAYEALKLAEYWQKLSDHTKSRTKVPAQFTKNDLQKLIMLCHPDKHGNSELANKATSKLIHLRNQL